MLRIFRMFAAGLSPKAIARALNAERISGPRGDWSPSTIYGHYGRGTGILNNELYVGRRVWNRQQYSKDPETGKRVSRPNLQSEWITTEVPELRIPGMDDALWEAAKARQAATRKAMERGMVQGRRPQYLFSKLTRCGSCGGGFTASSRGDLRCFNNTARGTCDNDRAIKRTEVEARVLRAMKERFFEPGAFDEFCRRFTEELNQLHMEQRAGLQRLKHDLSRANAEINKLIEAIKAGFDLRELKVEMDALQARKRTLLAQLAAGDAPPPLLHPDMSEVFRQKTEQLASALEHEDEEQRETARQALRGFIDRIVIPSGDGLLQVVGNFGEMLAAAGAKTAVAQGGCGGSKPKPYT